MNDKDILKQARERYTLEQDLTSDLRERMRDDERFKAGDQWPEEIKRVREQDPYGPRPCLVINHARTHANAVINDIRQNRPQIKVLPVDSDADVETAEMLNGLVRHIQVSGDADLAYDNSMTGMVDCGLGYFEVVTKVISDTEQEIDIEPILSAHAVHMDPFAENPTGSDAQWVFVDDPTLRTELEEQYPDVKLTDWDSAKADATLSGWYIDEDTVNVARYFYLEDDVWNVCKLVGDAILEQSTFPGKYSPIIRVAGEETTIDGKKDIKGLVRDIKDPCRIYNYTYSAIVEQVALATKAPWVGPAEGFEGYEDEWDRANTANIPRLSYNHTDEHGNAIPPPVRTVPVQQSTAMVQLLLQSHDDIKAISGKFDASLGNRSNETSGVAIRNRDRQGDTLTFHYPDNLSRSIRQCGRVIIGLVPLIYTADRVVRILGEDDSPDFAQVSGTGKAFTEEKDAAGQVQRIFDLTVGKYDVTVKAGPSFSTRRQEAVEEMSELLGRNPQAFQLIGHKLIRNMDWPGSDEAADILEAVLPPEVKQIIDAKKEGGDLVAAQMEQAQKAIMDQVEPAMQQLQQQAQEAGEAAQAASQENQMLKIQVAGKDLQNQELQTALRDKSGELEVKAMEVEAKATSEREAKEADIVIAAMGKEETQESSHSEEFSAYSSAAVAAQATQIAVTKMNELTQALAQQTQEIADASAETTKMLESVSEAHQEMSSEVVQLKDYVKQETDEKAKTKKAVLSFLKSDGSDKALARTVKAIEKS